MSIHLRPGLPDEAALARPADCLQPAEDLLRPFTLVLAGPVALLPGRSSVATRCAATIDTSDVGGRPVLSQMVDEGAHAITFVRAQGSRIAAFPARVRQHLFDCLAFLPSTRPFYVALVLASSTQSASPERQSRGV